MQVACPYCDCDVDVDDSNLVDLNSDNYIENWECDCCGREFDIYVEFEPNGIGEVIEHDFCNCCGKREKMRFLYKRGRTFPFPKDKNYSILCHRCYSELMDKEWKGEST